MKLFRKLGEVVERSFHLKVLLPVIAVLLLPMLGTLWIVNHHISTQLRISALEQLDTAGRVFRKSMETRSKHLVSQYRSVLNEPRIRAVTRQADFDTLKYSLTDIIQEAVLDKQASIAAFTFFKDGEKLQICTNAETEFASESFLTNALPSINHASKGQISTDTISVSGVLLQVVSLPVGSEYERSGVLTFGVKMDSTLADEIRQLTQSEVVFVAEGKVAASSMRLRDNGSELVRTFARQSLNKEREVAKGENEIVWDNEHYLAESAKFNASQGSSGTGYLLLSSYEKPLQDLRAMQRLLLTMGCAVLVTIPMLLWIVINKITAPLRELRDSVEAVGNDDLTRQVHTTSKDEVGELAVSFNQMVSKVKRSHEKLEQAVETLKATQHQLVQSEKLAGIGEFVAGVAHELNNPLTSVMGFSELLQQGELQEQHRRFVDVILKSAKRCQKIVQSLLSFARRHAPERKVVCANEIVESAVEIMSYQLRSSNIEVLTHLDSNLPPTELDSHQMQQVFINLINNARQAMEAHQPGGRLSIRTESSDSRVRILFKDTGPGISPENLKKIFNPFFTTKAVGKGTGLGLSLCYGIITEHGGSITPSSEPGEGATFTIELPVSKGQVTRVSGDSEGKNALENLEGTGKRVLVVDDEDSILQMIKEILTRQGYKVDTAHNGEAALKKLGREKYDLALCDWKMPGLSGQELFENLESSDNQITQRFVFITGDVVNEKTNEFLKSRNKPCLSKPFTLGEFSRAINQVAVNSNN